MGAKDNFENNVFYKVREAIQAEEFNCRKHASIVGSLVLGSQRVSIAHHIGEQEQLAREISKGIAEIPFKEGQKYVLSKEGHEAISYLEGHQAGEKQGRKEVVDSEIHINFACGTYTIQKLLNMSNEGKIQLKEWGL